MNCEQRMKIAIVGTGISGMTAAYLLSKKHDVVVYEQADRLGGHTATMDIEYAGEAYAIDTGFIVFNDWTYPHFQTLLAELAVDYQPTSMGFSVSCDQTGLEYSGESFNTLFAQRKNVLRLSHWRMLRDILRFNKQALMHVNSGGEFLTITLGEYLQKYNYSKTFMDKYLMPMGAAIWSSSTSEMYDFSLQFFVRFFKNHGLLSVNDRPQWHVIKGGSKKYIKPLTESYQQAIRLNSQVLSIERNVSLDDIGQAGAAHVENNENQNNNKNTKVVITTVSGDVDVFDQVVVAAHSDQALSMLADASHSEKAILGAIKYRKNDVALHTDSRLLPANKKVWSSWNYRILPGENNHLPPVLTYNMNILQGIHQAPATFCVTLNHTHAIAQEKILGMYQYAHPVFSMEAISAQQRWQEINGNNNTWYCGAYWFNGFHEDGVKSALRVAEHFGVSL